jgi:phage terminase large subunit-like protein
MGERPQEPNDPATAYALAVLAGTIVAGPYVRAACRRHQQDLELAAGRGYFWRPDLAERAFAFFREILRLNAGQFEGLPFELEPWQKFVIGSIFGWVDDNGFRRYQVAYMEAGKGNGKSPMAAGIGLTCWSPTARPAPRSTPPPASGIRRWSSSAMRSRWSISPRS